MHRSVTAAALLTLAAPSLAAQIVLDRPPNLGGTWVPDPGVVRFDFIHRFYVFPDKPNPVINSPTFTLAVGLPSRLALGAHYGTRDAGGSSHELELYARWRARAPATAGLALSLTPAYNVEFESVDGEAQGDWTRGRVTLSGAVRGMSNAYGDDEARAALAGGIVFRLNRYVAIGGDYASLLDRKAGEDPAWSAGLLFVIPGSPHTFSLHASNVDVNTIQGASRRGPLSAGIDKALFGFEFTIPLHLKRFGVWFGKGGAAATATGAAVAAAVQVRMEGFRYHADTVTISAGQAVRWINADPLEHTVTFAEGGPASSGLIPAGGSFVVQLDRPGMYPYHCLPHPFMKGVVTVR